MRYIKVNGVDYPHPIDFEMSTQPNITSQLTTMSGKMIADVNGWTYADVTLKWEYIESATLIKLIRETDPMQGAFELTFDDMATGTTTTVNAIRTGLGGQRLATVDENGNVVWIDIQMTLTFPDCYV